VCHPKPSLTNSNPKNGKMEKLREGKRKRKLGTTVGSWG
jgi:hypothetical protein